MSAQATLVSSGPETLLILAPDLELVRELQETLRRSGYSVDVSTVDNLEYVPAPDVRIVLLAASDSDPRTQDLCCAIKQRRPDLPILALGPDTWPTKLRFFALGVDEYVLWSVDRVELIARIRSLIRRRRMFLEK